MEFVKIGNKGKFHSAIYHRFLHSIVSINLHKYLVQFFVLISFISDQCSLFSICPVKIFYISMFFFSIPLSD